MNQLMKTTVAITLGLATAIAMAAPRQLTTHNNTDVESNAYVAGTIPSQHPTRAHGETRVMWTSVKMACFGHTVNNKCWATIKMATNTPNPIELGRVTIDIDTGEITPAQVTGNGYTITTMGPGETVLTKNP